MDRTVYMVAYNKLIRSYRRPKVGVVKEYETRLTTQAFAQRSHCEEKVKFLNKECAEENSYCNIEYIVWPIIVKSNI